MDIRSLAHPRTVFRQVKQNALASIRRRYREMRGREWNPLWKEHPAVRRRLERGEPIRLHLGSGNVESPGFINFDQKPGKHVDVVGDATDLSAFANASVDVVYACHVIEHFHTTELSNVLAEWQRVLRPGGVLRLSVPDFDKIVDIYLACDRDIDSIFRPLMGIDEGYGAHAAIFNQAFLSRILREVGFRETRLWDPAKVEDHDFEDWASRMVVRNGAQFPISLNIEAVR